jgi:hypothetical protein
MSPMFERLQSRDIDSEPSEDPGSDEEMSDSSEDHRGKKKRGMKIKPSELKELFDSSLDLHSLHRHMCEVTPYVQDGRVPKHRQVEIASAFLKGKPYSFFECICGDDPSSLSLVDFYKKSYNYVFPLNFQSEQSRKLVTVQQKGKHVRDHIGLFLD